jgi:hypothetical protein
VLQTGDIHIATRAVGDVTATLEQMATQDVPQHRRACDLPEPAGSEGRPGSRLHCHRQGKSLGYLVAGNIG